MNSSCARLFMMRREQGLILAAVSVSVIAFIVALLTGRYSLTFTDLLAMRSSGEHAEITRTILLESRLPRAIAAFLIGAALSASGAAFQAAFRNVLVSPGVLGVLSGAACGASTALLIGMGTLMVQFGAFIGGIAAVCLGLATSRLVHHENVLALLLGGVISNAIFSGLLAMLKYLADPYAQLPAITYWLLGSVAEVRWDMLCLIAPLILASIAILLICPRLLDAFSLSDDEARSLGLHIGWGRLLVIFAATLASVLTISLAGIIGWIGLLVPHIARLLIGAGHRHLMPMVVLLGGTLLLLADTFARSISASEIPLGIVTELFGAGCFVLVLRRLRDAAP